jgi:hypothetical protein
MKIVTVGAELFHADGRTDRHDETTRNSHFSQFCKGIQKHYQFLYKMAISFNS